MALSYREFLQVGREQWLVQPDLPRRLFLRLFGPLGVHARIRNTRVINAINRLELPAGARILDAGCGHAYATLFLAARNPGYNFTALELDRHLVENGRRITQKLGLDNVHFEQGSVTEIDAESAYDLVFSIDVLEHIVDDLDVLRRFHRALRPGGTLLLHLPRRHQEHRRIFAAFKAHTTPDHVRDEYTAADICQKLEQTGFSVTSLKYGFSRLGELAFELNYLFWKWNALRVATALALHPVSVRLAYLDTRKDYDDGNTLLVLARPLPASGEPAREHAR